MITTSSSIIAVALMTAQQPAPAYPSSRPRPSTSGAAAGNQSDGEDE
eukprot:CAMPEP_0170475460 /NCGR_PEP_ID=MMETSP0123-20130129/17107_1 /TAXON_ID=182087 /ORGANISM="Favella ehrenbergii, Strain Fehren 1" /LENGTH=46 /DNA_ID= /DNA_START= /DNA_END= /DNA_ORIENTATION=